MKKIVLIGGNGYIGRNVSATWLKVDKTAEFYVVSRSGKNKLVDPRIKNIQADITNYDELISKLPESFDYILDFVGRPESDPQKFKEVNDLPAAIMKKIALEKNVDAMGFIGGILGPKSFVEGKKAIEQDLRSSGIRTEVVAPTVVYGNGRQDTMMKLIPFLKFVGIFIKNVKPVHIDDVANELVTKMRKNEK